MKFIGVGEYEKVAEKLNEVFSQSEDETRFAFLSDQPLTDQDIFDMLPNEVRYITYLGIFISGEDENYRLQRHYGQLNRIKIEERIDLTLRDFSIETVLDHIAYNNANLYGAEGYEGNYTADKERYLGLIKR